MAWSRAQRAAGLAGVLAGLTVVCLVLTAVTGLQLRELAGLFGGLAATLVVYAGYFRWEDRTGRR